MREQAVRAVPDERGDHGAHKPPDLPQLSDHRHNTTRIVSPRRPAVGEGADVGQRSVFAGALRSVREHGRLERREPRVMLRVVIQPPERVRGADNGAVGDVDGGRRRCVQRYRRDFAVLGASVVAVEPSVALLPTVEKSVLYDG